jgi:hypothetical protein
LASQFIPETIQLLADLPTLFVRRKVPLPGVQGGVVWHLPQGEILGTGAEKDIPREKAGELDLGKALLKMIHEFPVGLGDLLSLDSGTGIEFDHIVQHAVLPSLFSKRRLFVGLKKNAALLAVPTAVEGEGGHPGRN